MTLTLRTHIFHWQDSSFFETILFHFVEQISFRAPEVDNFWAAVPVLLLDGALLAVVGVRDPRAPADDAAALVAPVVALVADPDQGTGPHIRITDGALAITLLTQPPYGHSGLLPAENEIWVMPGHISCSCSNVSVKSKVESVLYF